MMDCCFKIKQSQNLNFIKKNLLQIKSSRLKLSDKVTNLTVFNVNEDLKGSYFGENKPLTLLIKR